VAGALGVAGGSAPAAAMAASDHVAATSVDEERIQFEAGTDNAIREGNVDVASTDRWLLTAGAGQVMDLTINSADDNTVFTVFAPDRTVLATVSDDSYWSGTLPTSGDYSVEITSLDGPAYYILKVWIDAGYKDPLGLVQRITFAPGADSGTVGGAAIRATMDTWLLRAASGQTMSVTVTSLEANSTFNVFAPDGTGLTGVEARTTWTGPLPQDGDYKIAVEPTRGNATYTLTVQVTGGNAPLPAPPPPAPPAPSPGTTQRLSFAPGTNSATVSQSIAPGTVDRYILGAAAGQTMAVFIESDTGFISADIDDPNGVPLAIGQYEVGVQLVENGDYIVSVHNDSGIVGAYNLTVSIT